MTMNYRVVLCLLLGLSLAGCATTSSDDKIKQAAEANANLGLQYMLNGQYEVAMEKLNRALEHDDDNVNANHYMAELFNRLGRFDEADKYFRRAVRLADKDAALNNNYGVFLCGRKEFDEAEEQFLKALEDPVYRGRLDTMENLGTCLLDKPDLKKAEEHLRKVLALDARRPKTLLGMARINFEQKNYMSTRAYLQRYLEVARHTPETLWLGIRTERILGDRNALASYGMLLRNNFPNAEETRLYLKSNKP
ncbi:MAG TPA: type IV pilus biogenesis/stability protein PilW [Gammaproteobacteria bacterium]